jgi:nuclear pore complex protein Nup160
MSTPAPSYLYKETRVNLDSPYSNSTVTVRLSSNNGTSAFRSQKRAHASDIFGASDDERAFRRECLASAGSIFHRRWGSSFPASPRSFLWRVLEDGRVLCVRVVDLTKKEKSAAAPLTLRFVFPAPIRRECVAFADSKERDEVGAFVLTEANQLFTLTLKPEMFRRGAEIGEPGKGWVSGAWGFKYPHRLVALEMGELVVSLHDGGLMKLDRKSGEDGEYRVKFRGENRLIDSASGSNWKETFYNEGGWTQGLRSLIPFQGSNTVRHGKVSYELSTVTSIASPATTIDHVPYAFTVSLDHKLRIWNLLTGRIAYAGDILGQERLPNELGRYVIHPSQSNLVKVYSDNDQRVLLVTFSPIGNGEFKFWKVGASLQEEGVVDVEDLFPNDTLRPRAPTTDVWTLADFSVLPGQNGLASVWALWKNNTTYRVQKLEFHLNGQDDTTNVWENNWMGVASEVLAEAPLPTILPCDPSDETEKWLAYILYPGRFTAASIETALSLYASSLGGSPKEISRSSKSLAERMCSLVGSTATLSRTSSGDMDFELFHSATDTQWRRLCRLVIELEKHRGEALSLAFDAQQNAPWVITADGVSIVRECSGIERIWHNPDTVLPGIAGRVADVIVAAKTFRESFPDQLLYSCNAVLKSELLQDPSHTEPVRMRSFYDRCNFASQIGDEDYTQLVGNLGGFGELKQEIYQSLLGAMTVPEDLDLRAKRAPLTDFGKKTVVRGIQETIELHRTVCFDQLALLIFVEGEIDQQEEGMDLETAVIYKQLLIMLKRLELLSWLAGKQIAMLSAKTERGSFSKDKSLVLHKKTPEETKTVTVLEGSIGHLLGFDTAQADQSLTSVFTDSLIRVCDPDGEYELVPSIIQCYLLRSDRVDLALEFMQFCDQDPFATYVQGRTHLAARDLPNAAMCFKKAAYGLGKPAFHPT